MSDIVVSLYDTQETEVTMAFVDEKDGVGVIGDHPLFTSRNSSVVSVSLYEKDPLTVTLRAVPKSSGSVRIDVAGWIKTATGLKRVEDFFTVEVTLGQSVAPVTFTPSGVVRENEAVTVALDKAAVSVGLEVVP